MEKEIAGLSERMARVEGILEQMSERLNHVESRMDSEFKAIRAEMSSHFRWTLAVIMSMWVTVIVAILFK